MENKDALIPQKFLNWAGEEAVRISERTYCEFDAAISMAKETYRHLLPSPAIEGKEEDNFYCAARAYSLCTFQCLSCQSKQPSNAEEEVEESDHYCLDTDRLAYALNERDELREQLAKLTERLQPTPPAEGKEETPPLWFIDEVRKEFNKGESSPLENFMLGVFVCYGKMKRAHRNDWYLHNREELVALYKKDRELLHQVIAGLQAEQDEHWSK